MRSNNTDELKEKLKEKLMEIFQFESENLDFGIYRIMNYKRKEIEKFISGKLMDDIKRHLVLLSEEEIKEIEENLKEISSKNGVKKYLEALKKGDKERIRIYKEDFAKEIEEYNQLVKQLEKIKISEDLEGEIYNHLINFFTRYYDNGDFISKRRYGKNEKYAIPYNGEEVLLYWTNKDQYYIKTTEHFKKYTYKVKGLTVNFRVVDAEEEKGNVKSQEKKFFVLNEKIFDFDEEKKELNIYFEYRGLTDEEKNIYGNQKVQEKINEKIIKILEEKIPRNDWTELIFKKDGEKTLIEKHLYRYTKRNTTDYFIHKDLKGFLERELDFYIKNEFLQLDDLQVLEQGGYFDKLRLYLIGIRTFRNIALNIIEFLAQIENFQKKLWEKKKFVINTHYVITMDKINEYAGEEFLESILDDILSNEKQKEEWKKLFGMEIKNKNDLIENNTLNGKEWKKLPIDTKYFDEEFKWKLLIALSERNDLDEILDGILIKSENFQALNLLLGKYYEKVQTIYIDPPYNTGNDGFLYKDIYQHSSWLTMMENRLSLAKELMKDDGVIFVSVGDTIRKNLRVTSTTYLQHLNNNLFNEENFIATIVRKSGIAPRQDVKHIANAHDYILVYSKDFEKAKINKKTADISRLTYKDNHFNERGYFDLNQLDRGSVKYSESLDYPIIIEKGQVIEIFDGKSFKKQPAPERIEIWPGNNPKDKRWIFRWSKEKVKWGIKNDFIVFRRPNGKWKVYYKEYELVDNNLNKRERTNPFDTLILDYPNEHGTKEIENLFKLRLFEYPKPSDLIKYLLKIGTNKNTFVLDFFAGSGTTAHAVMKLNKKDKGKRKFILVEMADYFDTVIIPRIKKVAYSFNWKEGKPQNTNGTGVFFKYHTLEQYEDALENIEFEEQNEAQKEILYNLSDYFVKYMLEWETKNSRTFLKLDDLKDPFNYKLKIIENYQQKIVNVDLIETFNYLLGLHVKGYKIFEDNGRKYVFVFGEKNGKRTTVVWRNTEDIDFEKDKEVIENAVKEFNPDELYINRDALVKGFKVIESLFKSLMFEEVL